VKIDNKLINDVGKENENPTQKALRQKAQEDATKEKEQQRALEEQERQRKEFEATVARQAADAAKQGAERQAAEARERAAREEQQRQEAAAAKAHEEDAERQRRAQEEAEKKALEDAKKAEEEKARKEQEMQAAIKAKERATVETWLNKNCFAGIDAPKKSMFKTNYPLHVAVSKGEAEIVGCLCRCGADKTVKNSSKQVPLELAQKNSKKGSPQALACVAALSDVQTQ
jgi:hypothetical protein